MPRPAGKRPAPRKITVQTCTCHYRSKLKILEKRPVPGHKPKKFYVSLYQCKKCGMELPLADTMKSVVRKSEGD